MAQSITDRIIIVKKVKYGESDLIVHAINSSGARIHFIAKGALRSKKRFGGGVLEPTHFVEVNYKEKRGEQPEGGLHFLNEAKVLNDFSRLREDYDRLELGLYFVGLVSKVVQEGALEEQSIFDLIGHALNQAQTSENLALLRAQFELKFLYQQGVLPEELADPDLMSVSLVEHGAIEISENRLSGIKLRISHFLTDYLGH